MIPSSISMEQDLQRVIAMVKLKSAKCNRTRLSHRVSLFSKLITDHAGMYHGLTLSMKTSSPLADTIALLKSGKRQKPTSGSSCTSTRLKPLSTRCSGRHGSMVFGLQQAAPMEKHTFYQEVNKMHGLPSPSRLTMVALTDFPGVHHQSHACSWPRTTTS